MLSPHIGVRKITRLRLSTVQVFVCIAFLLQHFRACVCQVVVTFAGSDNPQDFDANRKFDQVHLFDGQVVANEQPVSEHWLKTVQVHRGFKEYYASVHRDVLQLVYHATGQERGWRLTFVGHSLGAALGTLGCVYMGATTCVPASFVRLLATALLTAATVSERTSFSGCGHQTISHATH